MTTARAEVLKRWPTVFHMAERGAWQSIRRHGLRSTVALLDLFEVDAPRREILTDHRRPANVTITHPVHGEAILRDNRPINETVLHRTLVGMSETEWYRSLNSRVYFWVSFERVERLRATPAYRSRPHELLEVDTADLLDRYGDVVEASPYNSGAVHPGSTVQRGAETFCKLDAYKWDEHLVRNRREPIVELTVPYAVPDIVDLVKQVRQI